ncbi:MAG: hypothetical protein EOP46_09930 [Sphingobacteriaceae bacterium]|nr:MAG: hypothetical protein EOP46_09930 [Sphingobacteriaceae bacterium]
MLKKLLITCIAVILFASCSKSTKCGERLCDASFAFVTVMFVDSEGNGIAVKDYSAVNLRTKDTLKSSAAVTMDVVPGVYFVADDSHKDALSKEGDEIKVSGTNITTNITKTATFKISGGKCECHITKISGPEKIQFD